MQMNPKFARALIDQANELGNARIFEGGTQRPLGAVVLDIGTDLATAKPRGQAYKVGFPFKSLLVQDATDSSVIVNMLIGSQDSIQGAVKLRQNVQMDFDYPINEAYLYWDAQAAKTISLVFMPEGTIKPGSLLSTVAGGVAIIDGSTFTRARETLVAATEKLVFAASSTRKLGTVENLTGATIYYGETGITNSGLTQGLSCPPGGILQWRNAAALYLYSVGGGDYLKLEES